MSDTIVTWGDLSWAESVQYNVMSLSDDVNLESKICGLARICEGTLFCTLMGQMPVNLSSYWLMGGALECVGLGPNCAWELWDHETPPCAPPGDTVSCQYNTYTNHWKWEHRLVKNLMDMTHGHCGTCDPGTLTTGTQLITFQFPWGLRNQSKW